MPLLLHIVEPDAWDADGEIYRPSSLRTEGFIHLSHPHQIEATANRFYGHCTAIRVLEIEAAVVASRVREEDTSGHGAFPHLYSAMRRSWVRRVVSWNRGADGFRALPGWT